MHVLFLVDAASLKGKLELFEQCLARILAGEFPGNPINFIFQLPAIPLCSARLLMDSTAAAGGVFEPWNETSIHNVYQLVAASRTSSSSSQERMAKAMQLIAHQTFAQVDKHEVMDCILYFGHSFAPALFRAAAALTRSRSFPGRRGIRFAFVDFANSNRACALNNPDSNTSHITVEHIMTSTVVVPRTGVRKHAKAQDVAAAGTTVQTEEEPSLQTVEEIISALPVLAFAQFRQAYLSLNAESTKQLEQLCLAQDQFSHLGIVLLARDAANVQQVKRLLVTLSISWNDSQRLIGYLKQELQVDCCAEVWQMVCAQFLDELEEQKQTAEVPAALKQRETSVLERVNSLKSATPCAAAAVRSTSSVAPAIVPKIPLVLTKRNGKRGALNHFVGEYLSNPNAHFRQVRASTAAVKRQPTTTRVASAAPSATTTTVNESPQPPQASTVMETPIPPPNAAAPAHYLPTRTSAKRLFMDDDL